MAYARIITRKNKTIIRTINFPVTLGVTTAEVDGIAATLDSIICEDKDILAVEVDYAGCDDSETLG